MMTKTIQEGTRNQS